MESIPPETATREGSAASVLAESAAVTASADLGSIRLMRPLKLPAGASQARPHSSPFKLAQAVQEPSVGQGHAQNLADHKGEGPPVDDLRDPLAEVLNRLG